MFNISGTDSLFKVHPFRIERAGSGIIWIDVYEHLNSSSDGLFYALPVDKPLPLSSAKEQFRATGKTLEEALNSCLNSIEGLGSTDLFEKKGK